mmetsp:Transcript_21188/g.39407  ORF Transcript_21188/g.39407 Transcript_21188/m.39407 type:complete len:509 (+) Transcript_21188:100-1626(+)
MGATPSRDRDLNREFSGLRTRGTTSTPGSRNSAMKASGIRVRNTARSEEELQRRVLEATREGHADEVVRLISGHSASHATAALYGAARTGQINVVEALGAEDISVDLNVQRKALTIAVRAGQVGMVRDLVLGNAMQLDVDRWSPLIEAVSIWASMRKKKPEGINLVVDELVRLGADPCAVDRTGHNALHFAAMSGRPDMIHRFVSYGVDPNVRDSDHQSAIALAVENGHTDCIQVLVLYGASLQDDFEQLILKATSRDYSNVLSTLLEFQDETDLKPEIFNESVLIAAEQGFAACLKILVKHDANVNVLDKEGYSALYLAANEGHTEILKILLNAGAKVGQGEGHPLHEASSSASHEMVQALLESGAIPSEKDDNGKIPLHYAAASPSVKSVQLLLNAGASVSTKCPSGQTALHCAAWMGRTENIKALLAHGSEVNAISNAKKTPLHMASSRAFTDSVQALLDAGADINAVDRRGLSALELAKKAKLSTKGARTRRAACIELLSSYVK